MLFYTDKRFTKFDLERMVKGISFVQSRKEWTEGGSDCNLPEHEKKPKSYKDARGCFAVSSQAKYQTKYSQQKYLDYVLGGEKTLQLKIETTVQSTQGDCHLLNWKFSGLIRPTVVINSQSYWWCSWCKVNEQVDYMAP